MHRPFRFHASKLATFVLCVPLIGCGDQSSAIEKGMPPPTKSIGELKQAAPNEMSAEELKAARKAAGFKSRDEVAAENAAMFEADARKYVKERLKEYRALLADLRKHVDELEKSAEAWAKAKDPAPAIEKFKEKTREPKEALTKTYNDLTGHGAEGGETQVVLGQAFRGWEEAHGALDAEIVKSEEFKTAISDIRKRIDEVEAKLEAIEKEPAPEEVAKSN